MPRDMWIPAFEGFSYEGWPAVAKSPVRRGGPRSWWPSLCVVGCHGAWEVKRKIFEEMNETLLLPECLLMLINLGGQKYIC